MTYDQAQEILALSAEHDGNPTSEMIEATNVIVNRSRELKHAKLDYDSAIKKLIGDVPNTELSSWPKQESEARNLDKETPLIDGLIVSRGLGETREELAAKIIANADAYAVGYAKVLGEYQAKLKAIGGQ